MNEFIAFFRIPAERFNRGWMKRNQPWSVSFCMADGQERLRQIDIFLFERHGLTHSHSGDRKQPNEGTQGDAFDLGRRVDLAAQTY